MTMWYIVLSRSLPEQEKNKELHYEEHRQWLEDQHRMGRLLFSGPTADRAYGIYIMLAASKDEAERIAAQDPHHVIGCNQYITAAGKRRSSAVPLEAPHDFANVACSPRTNCSFCHVKSCRF